MHGLSGGIIVLAIAGFFWLNLSAWSADCRLVGLVPWTTQDVPLRYVLWTFWCAAAGTAWLIAGALRVRKKAEGFTFRDRRATDAQRVLTRRIGRSFLLVALAEGAGCALSALLGMHFHREELIWPAVSLVVSLHFLPLARIFRNPPYTITGVAGSIISLALLLLPQFAVGPATRVMLLGLAMAPVMWITAIYVIAKSDELARNWEAGLSL